MLIPALAIAQADTMVIDTTIVTQSPLDFDKLLTPESIAKLFGADAEIYLIFIACIMVLTEICRSQIKMKGQYFFVDNKSFMLPPIIGILLALIIPLGFGFLATVRFGLQGAIGAMIIHWLTSFIHRERKN